MKEINLRVLFPEYELDCFVEVTDEDAEAFTASMTKEAAAIYFEAEREESTSRRRKYRHKAHYSLDAGDGIEHDALHKPLPPHEIFERGEVLEALCGLPEKQLDRIYKHYFLGINKAETAWQENIHKMSVSDSINCGIRSLEKMLKK